MPRIVVERATWPERERSAGSTTAYGHRSDLSRGRGQHRCWRCCRSWGHSGTPWTRSSTFLGFRRSMVLCRLWWISWWTCSSSLTRFFLLPSRLSTCPRSSSRTSVREPQLAEQLVEVPTVLTPTRIALRIAEQIVDTPVPRGRDKRRVQGFFPSTEFSSDAFCGTHFYAFLSGLCSRTLTFLLVLALDRGLPLLLVPQKRILLGFVALFLMEKSAECRAGQCGPAPARQLIHTGGSARLGLVVGITHSCSAGRVGGGQGGSEKGAREQEEEEEVNTGSGMFLVLLVTFFFVLCSLQSSSGLRCPASWRVWT